MERIESLTEQQARDATDSEERTEKLGSQIESLREEIEEVRGNVVLGARDDVTYVKKVGGYNCSPF